MVADYLLSQNNSVSTAINPLGDLTTPLSNSYAGNDTSGRLTAGSGSSGASGSSSGAQAWGGTGGGIGSGNAFIGGGSGGSSAAGSTGNGGQGIVIITWMHPL